MASLIVEFSHKSETGEKLYRWLYSHCIAIFAIASVTLYLTWPALLSSGIYPGGIDTPAHFFKLDLMESMLVEHGQIFNWSNKWYGGYPFLGLYAPVTYYLLLGVEMVVGSNLLAFNLFRVTLLFLTGLSTYLVLRRELEKKSIATVGGVLAITAVPVHNNIFAVGRIPYATGLVIYLLSIYVVFDRKIWSKDLNRHHLYFAGVMAFLFITHPMTAYFMAITGILFTIVYWQRVRELGLRPLILMGGLIGVISMPYLVTFLKHSYITNPFWIGSPVPADLMQQVTRAFNNSRPRYLGAVHVGLIMVGLISTVLDRERFKTFAAANFGVFYVFFWSLNLGILKYIPLHDQFDMPRFEVMFMVWGTFVAAYGLKDIVGSWGLDIRREKLVFALVIGLLLFDVGPLAQSTYNWSPNFDEADYGMNQSYRAMMTGARHWDDYMLPVKFEVSDTFGWFMQADPHYNFSQTLQNTGGVWYPGDWDFPRKENSTLRENLMRLSNTKYIMFAKKGWVGEKEDDYILGDYYRPEHPYNARMYNVTKNDADFRSIYSSETLDIFELKTEMSYCEKIEPVWINKNYFSKAREMFSTGEAFPELPVNHRKPSNRSNSADIIDCSQISPIHKMINTSGPAWVLIKESYYPYWHRRNGKPIYNAFGFIVTHVNGTGKIVYNDQRAARGSNSLRS